MSRPSCATATLATFQRGLDLAPQSRCNRLEPRPINGPIADAVPPAKHPLGQTQQDAPRSFPTAPTIDHGLEIPLQVRPADLSPRRLDPLSELCRSLVTTWFGLLPSSALATAPDRLAAMVKTVVIAVRTTHN